MEADREGAALPALLCAGWACPLAKVLLLLSSTRGMWPVTMLVPLCWKRSGLCVGEPAPLYLARSRTDVPVSCRKGSRRCGGAERGRAPCPWLDQQCCKGRRSRRLGGAGIRAGVSRSPVPAVGAGERVLEQDQELGWLAGRRRQSASPAECRDLALAQLGRLYFFFFFPLQDS